MRTVSARGKLIRAATPAVFGRLDDLHRTASERANDKGADFSEALPAGLFRAGDVVQRSPKGDAVVHVTANMLTGNPLVPEEATQVDTLEAVLRGPRERRIHLLVEGIPDPGAVMAALAERLGGGEPALRLGPASIAVHSLSARSAWREGAQVRLDRILSDIGARSPSVFVVYQEGVRWLAGRWTDRLAAFIVALAGGLSADMSLLLEDEVRRQEALGSNA
jgi:hypothetical protein